MKDKNRAVHTVRNYGTGIRHEGFNSILNYAATEGGPQITQKLNRMCKVGTSGSTEYLYAFTQSGQSTITSSNNSCGGRIHPESL